MTPGTPVVTIGEQRVVDSVRLVPQTSTTFNLEVSQAHSFFAGQAQVLVHNGDDDAVVPRNFNDPRPWTGEIYHVSIRRNGRWEVVYVGSTNKEGLTFARFDEHLRQGRLGSRGYRSDKAEWDRLRTAGNLDTETTSTMRRWGDIRVEITERGEFTDLALNILEEAHRRRFPEAQLQNRDAALSEEAFKKYYTPEHAPCR